MLSEKVQIINIRAQINERGNKKIIRKVTKTKIYFFEKSFEDT